MALFRLIPQSDWSTVDDRVWAHPGAVVDLGCWPWDWSAPFIGKKRVVGADPQAVHIEGADVFTGVIGAANGSVDISDKRDDSSSLLCEPGAITRTVPMVTWKRFVQTFGLNQIAILKINIEGSEYPLLHSMDWNDFVRIDQIAVSFHHFVWPQKIKATTAALNYLRDNGYTVQPTNNEWGWYLCLR